MRQQIRVHAIDGGELTVHFRLADGYLARMPKPIRFGGITTGPGATCTVGSTTVPDLNGWNLNCRLEPGDHTIGYELTGDGGQYAQHLRVATTYNIYNFGIWDSTYLRRLSVPFAAQGRPVLPRHGLLARDTTGALFGYSGTGVAGTPLAARYRIGTGWQTYSTITSLSPYRQGLYYRADVKPSAVTRGLGDLVGRDASGTLWYYDRQLVGDKPFAPRVKVGGGWSIYDRIDGAGDLDRDGYMDLLARDKAGVLWLYEGTGSFTSARFKTRVRIGGGWGAYDQLAGGADVTGDGRADLLARDRAGCPVAVPGNGQRYDSVRHPHQDRRLLEHLQPARRRRRPHRRRQGRRHRPRHRRIPVAVQGHKQPGRPVHHPHQDRKRLEHLQPNLLSEPALQGRPRPPWSAATGRLIRRRPSPTSPRTTPCWEASEETQSLPKRVVAHSRQYPSCSMHTLERPHRMVTQAPLHGPRRRKPSTGRI